MTDMMSLLAQFVLTGCLAGWMVSAVFNNWRFPVLNEDAVAMVMRFELMQQDYPEQFAVMRHRVVQDRRLIRLVFRCMVLMETLAALTLLAGAVLLGLALPGAVPTELARMVALCGTLIFVANWTGFLIGGEYFCYWYCHFGSQATHMMLAIWGTVVSGLLLVG